MRRRNNGVTILFIGLAAATGALIALVLAPQSGKQMRKTLRRKYEDARDTMDELGDQASDWMEKSAELADKAKNKVAPLKKAFAR